MAFLLRVPSVKLSLWNARPPSAQDRAHLIDIVFARFGTVATLLEMIPVASILFSFTNTGEFLVSAAAWLGLEVSDIGHFSRGSLVGRGYREKGERDGKKHSSWPPRDGEKSRVRRNRCSWPRLLDRSCRREHPVRHTPISNHVTAGMADGEVQHFDSAVHHAV